MFNRKTVFSIIGILLVMPFIGATVSSKNNNFSKIELSSSFEGQAFQYLEHNKERYQINNPGESYKLDRIVTDKFGLTHTHLQRYYHGVPIYGSSIIFHQDANGTILSISEEHADFSDDITTEPTIKPKKAISVVKRHFTKISTEERVENAKINITLPQLYIYDRSFFSNVASHPRLIWRLTAEVRDTPIQYVYYIDAQTGEVVHHLSTTAHARDRETYVLSTTPDCNTETLTYNESGLVGTYDADAGWVHLYAGYAYQYYYDTFGRDSFDDEDPNDTTDGGGTIKSYTHYRDPDGCIDEFDAAWVSQSTEPYEFMYFAEGVYGQDIVGHEFTHGVVDHSANFEYENESGALDESYADIFGTLIEQYTGETDWTIGEDLPTNRSGCTTALRSLADPAAYTGRCDGSGDSLPDHDDEKLELEEDAVPSEDNDNGYVHTNSSIVNYAFYLLAVGGTHPTSGVSVTGIGTSAAAELYYQALTNYLSINSNFDAAYEQTLTACLDLNASDSTTYPLSYCESVFDAFAAVGINTDTSYAWANISASATSGTSPVTITFDGTGSTAINSTITNYSWNFGDGSSDTGDTVNYTYSNPGTYTVTLTVTDSNGYTNSASVTITVYATGSISSDTTWSANYSPYVIDGSISVGTGSTLTIEPGTVIKFYDTTSSLTINGTLAAQGTSTDGIVFTSFKDDDFGGDTNEDGTATTPAVGDWYYLNMANNAVATFDYVTIQYGGYTGGVLDYAMLRVSSYSSSVSITNSTIQYSQYHAMQTSSSSTTSVINSTVNNNSSSRYGIYIAGGTVTISNSIITDQTSGWGYGVYIADASPILSNNTISNGSYGIYVTGSSAAPVITDNILNSNTRPIVMANLTSGSVLSGNSGSGNVYNGIILSGSVNGDFALEDDNDLPYLIETLTVNSGNTLTIDPGMVIKFLSSSTYYLSISGVLSAQGTSPDPIIFTSYKDDTYGGDTNQNESANSPTAGDWGYIKAGSSSTLIFDYVTVMYGGGSSKNMLWIDDNAASVSIDHSSFSNSNYHTIGIESGSTTSISNSSIANTASSNYAIYHSGGTTTLTDNIITASNYGVRINDSSPTITNNTISAATWDIFIYGSSAEPALSGNVITDATYGVYTYNNANPTLTDNLVYGNSSYGLYNTSTTVTITAENNWWGDASGPYHATSNPSGTGDTVSDYIDFDPWATSEDMTPPSDVTLGITRKDVWAQTITLNWTNPTDSDFDHIQIDRTDVTAGTTTTLSSTETGTSYTDSTPSYTTTYTYTLYTVDTTGNISTGVTTPNQRLRNPTPTGLTLTAGDTTIAATWTVSSAPSPTLGGYIVYYGTARDALTTSVDVGNITSTTLTGLINYTRYYVAVTAYNTSGDESAVSTVRATRPHP